MQSMPRDDDYGFPFVAPFAMDDDDWRTWNDMLAMRDQVPTVALHQQAAGGGPQGFDAATGVAPVPQTLITAPTPIICQDIASIPPGRQASAILQCGICLSPHLYARKADLKRHMETHLPATHFCHVNNCPRGPGNGFKRIDKLHEHLNKKHGLRQN